MRGPSDTVGGSWLMGRKAPEPMGMDRRIDGATSLSIDRGTGGAFDGGRGCATRCRWATPTVTNGLSLRWVIGAARRRPYRQAMSERDLLVLALTVENSELRTQLAEAQDHLVEMAVDAGYLHARIDALQAEMAALREERNAWRAEALRRQGRADLRDQA